MSEHVLRMFGVDLIEQGGGKIDTALILPHIDSTLRSRCDVLECRPLASQVCRLIANSMLSCIAHLHLHSHELVHANLRVAELIRSSFSEGVRSYKVVCGVAYVA